MMLLSVFTFLILASIVARTKPLMMFGCFYSVVHVAHQLTFDGGGAAYAYAAITGSLLCIIFLAYLSVKYQTKWQLLPLSIIMFASIIHGYYGLVVYNMHADVELLNIFGFAIYVSVIAGLLWSHDIGELVGMDGDSDIRNRSPLWGLAGSNAGYK